MSDDHTPIHTRRKSARFFPMAKGIKKGRIYFDTRVLSVFFLGFSSGLPFLLALATFHVWLAETDVTKGIIGLFAMATFPYTLKFLWAPFMDHRPFPLLSELLGHRKGWLLGSQWGVMVFLVLLGASHPQDNLWWPAFCVLGLSFFSATQDAAYEAFRVESLPQELTGAGAGASSFGYRLGMWIAGAGALYLASFFSWFVVYTLMACMMTFGMVTTLLITEPKQAPKEPTQRETSLASLTVQSVQSLIKRPDVWFLFSFILSFKILDVVLNTLTMPFLLDLGFSKVDIATVAKGFGIFCMMIGGGVGGILLTHRPLYQVLALVVSLQSIASLLFMTQAWVGSNIQWLFVTMGMENLACGMGTSAFIALLSGRCQKPFTATHFALLSSFGSLCRILISPVAGFVADHMSWAGFYGSTALMALPCLWLILSHRPHLFPVTPTLHPPQLNLASKSKLG